MWYMSSIMFTFQPCGERSVLNGAVGSPGRAGTHQRDGVSKGAGREIRDPAGPDGPQSGSAGRMERPERPGLR